MSVELFLVVHLKQESMHVFCCQRYALTSSNLHHALLANLWITALQALQLGLQRRANPAHKALNSSSVAILSKTVSDKSESRSAGQSDLHLTVSLLV